jgi:hypothetical protein
LRKIETSHKACPAHNNQKSHKPKVAKCFCTQQKRTINSTKTTKSQLGRSVIAFRKSPTNKCPKMHWLFGKNICRQVEKEEFSVELQQMLKTGANLRGSVRIKNWSF